MLADVLGRGILSYRKGCVGMPSLGSAWRLAVRTGNLTRSSAQQASDKCVDVPAVKNSIYVRVIQTEIDRFL